MTLTTEQPPQTAGWRELNEAERALVTGEEGKCERATRADKCELCDRGPCSWWYRVQEFAAEMPDQQGEGRTVYLSGARLNVCRTCRMHIDGDNWQRVADRARFSPEHALRLNLLVPGFTARIHHGPEPIH